MSHPSLTYRNHLSACIHASTYPIGWAVLIVGIERSSQMQRDKTNILNLQLQHRFQYGQNSIKGNCQRFTFEKTDLTHRISLVADTQAEVFVELCTRRNARYFFWDTLYICRHSHQDVVSFHDMAEVQYINKLRTQGGENEVLNWEFELFQLGWTSLRLTFHYV